MKTIVSDFGKGIYWKEHQNSTTHKDPMHQLAIYPECRGPQFIGFGGAFTESAGYCFQLLNPSQQQRFLKDYFSQEGLGYTLGRTHMNSCDFSLGNYACAASADDSFSMQRDHKYIIPLLQAASKVSGQPIGLVLSAWSPPGFMKSNGQMNNGGHLRPEYQMLWSQWIAKYVQEYRAAGCDVQKVTVQNEPAAIQEWDSCLYSGKEEGLFAAEYLRPALDALDAGDVGILVWDHNKDLLVRRALETMNVPGAREAVSGFAVHWYAGDHFEALNLTRKLYPEKELWFTEGCVEYSRFSHRSDGEKALMYAHDILGNLRSGVCASIDWNLLLDQNGGPNHVGNYCEAPIMLTADGYEKKASYYAIGHFSKYIKPGARQLESSIYDSRLESVVFENPDGSRTAVILNNSSRELPVWISENGEAGLYLTSAPKTLTTVLWESKEQV